MARCLVVLGGGPSREWEWDNVNGKSGLQMFSNPGQRWGWGEQGGGEEGEVLSRPEGMRFHRTSVV